MVTVCQKIVQFSNSIWCKQYPLLFATFSRNYSQDGKFIYVTKFISLCVKPLISGHNWYFQNYFGICFQSN